MEYINRTFNRFSKLLAGIKTIVILAIIGWIINLVNLGVTAIDTNQTTVEFFNNVEHLFMVIGLFPPVGAVYGHVIWISALL